MTKRIVSGVFILLALGALGVILAGALNSGEQLIVRFLTAVIVAALGLYVISDLRLQADDETMSAARNSLTPQMAMVDAPPNSTAAFMATVTQKEHDQTAGETTKTFESGALKRSKELLSSAKAKDVRTELPAQDLGTAPSSTTEQASAVVEGAGSPPTIENASIVNDPRFSPPSAPGSSGATEAAATLGHMPSDVAASNAAERTESETNLDQSAVETVKVEPFAWPSPPSRPSDEDETDSHSGIGNSTEKPQRPKPDGYRVELTAVSSQSSSMGSEMGTTSNDRGADHQIDVSLVGEPPKPIASGPAPTRDTVSAAHYADAPLAPIIDLRGPATVEGDIEEAISAGEVEVVATLIDQGMLATSGPISDREVRTMVYVAFTSNELRKLLRAGGHPDVPGQAPDLGPVELFDANVHRPTPKRLYTGLPDALEASSQSG